MKLTRPPLLHHTQPQPRPRHAGGRRRRSLLLIRRPPSPRFGKRSAPRRPCITPEAHAQHHPETLKPRKIAPLRHNMLENRSTRRTRSGRRTSPPLKSQPPPRDIPRDGLHIRGTRGGDEGNYVIYSPSNPKSAPIPRLFRSAPPSRTSIRSIPLTPPYSPSSPSTPSNSLSTHFSLSYLTPISHSYLISLTYPSHTAYTPHHLAFQTPSLYDITNNITICYILLGTLLVHFSQNPPLTPLKRPFYALSPSIQKFTQLSPNYSK